MLSSAPVEEEGPHASVSHQRVRIESPQRTRLPLKHGPGPGPMVSPLNLYGLMDEIIFFFFVQNVQFGDLTNWYPINLEIYNRSQILFFFRLHHAMSPNQPKCTSKLI